MLTVCGARTPPPPLSPEVDANTASGSGPAASPPTTAHRAQCERRSRRRRTEERLLGRVLVPSCLRMQTFRPVPAMLPFANTYWGIDRPRRGDVRACAWRRRGARAGGRAVLIKVVVPKTAVRACALELVELVLAQLLTVGSVYRLVHFELRALDKAEDDRVLLSHPTNASSIARSDRSLNRPHARDRQPLR